MSVSTAVRGQAPLPTCRDHDWFVPAVITVMIIVPIIPFAIRALMHGSPGITSQPADTVFVLSCLLELVCFGLLKVPTPLDNYNAAESMI